MSQEELKIADQVIRDRDEFTIYSNLASRYQTRTQSDGVDALGDAPVERRGLAWITALARVELGAMIAGFTEREAPFEVFAPTRYDRMQYEELMADSLRTHYGSLQNDPLAQFYWAHKTAVVSGQDVSNGRRYVKDSQAISYVRRVQLARRFAGAVDKLGRGHLSPPQRSSLKYADKQLESLQTTIVKKVLALGNYRTEGTSVSHSESDTVRTCGVLLRAANKELRAGTASWSGPKEFKYYRGF